MITKIKRKIIVLVAKVTAPLHKIKQRKKLLNNDVSIISQNCIGGVIYHDLGLRFLSPTINLYMNSSDFITFVENIAEFKKAKLQFIDSNKDYPVATLSYKNKEITINFVHYNSCKEAEKKWKERYSRINFNNLCVIMTDRDGFNCSIIERFEKMPYKKLIFTSKKLKIKDSIYMNEFSGQSQVGDLIAYKSFLGKRYYEKIDIVDWLNSVVEKNNVELTKMT